jgi:serine/threonine protein kinase
MGPGRSNREGPRRDHTSGPNDTETNQAAADTRHPVTVRRAASARYPSIDGFLILNEIHRGGQGVVYRAEQLATRRIVALKVLLQGPFASEEQRHRFRREVELAASLRHSNIVTIYDGGIARDGSRFLVMEHINGQPIDQFHSQRKLGPAETLALVEKICRAVNVAHEKRIIHRDLKPPNILVDAAGEPHILDFGLARLTGAGHEASESVTQTGDFLGTRGYAAPEQLAGMPSLIDARTDVYALGRILFQLLTGEVPDRAAGPPGAGGGDGRIEAPRRRPSRIRPELDRDVDTIVLAATAEEQDRRYATAGAIADDIARYLAGEPIQARRDHVLYVAAKRLKRWMLQNSKKTRTAAVAISVAIAYVVGTPLVFEWTPANRMFERFVVIGTAAAAAESAVAAVGPDAAAVQRPWQRVRVLAMTDATDMPALARRAGIERARADDVKSWRSVHGALMRRLVPGRPRVVVWDIEFRGATPFDRSLAEGVSALREAGIPVVAAVRKWWFDESTLPEISHAIAPLVEWGCTDVHFEKDTPWRVTFAAQRDGQKVLPSLSLAAAALWRHPDADYEIGLDAPGESATIRYSKPHPALPRARIAVKDVDTVPLRIEDESKNWPDFGIKSGDRVGHLSIRMPADAVLDSATVEYARVFTAEETELRDWFEGRVVFIGDLRPGTDRHPHAGRSDLPGCYGHAFAVEKALADADRPVPLTRGWLLIIGLALSATMGMMMGAGFVRQTRRRIVALLIAAAAYLGSGAALAALGIIWNPMVPFLALLLACELCAAARHMRPGPDHGSYLELTR